MNPFDSHSGGRTGWIFQINASPGGVPKTALPQGEVTFSGLNGDRQRNLDVHGGPERALCLYSLELIIKLQKEGHPIFPGAAGENLTLTGLDWDLVIPAAQLRLGRDLTVEVTRYTSPCSNIAYAFKEQVFTRISQKVYPGWSRAYVRVLHPGVILPGDLVEIL